MKVLMLGWEFPPYISGGLGTACYGLTKALSQQQTEIAFVLPRPVNSLYSSHVRLLSPLAMQSSEEWCSMSSVRLHPLDIAMYPYGSQDIPTLPVGMMGMQARHSQKTSPGGSGITKLQNSHSALNDSVLDAQNNYGSDLYAQTHRYIRLACDLSSHENFDIIHAHDWMTYPAGMAIAKQSGRPLVIHVHSTEFDRSGECINQWIYDIERQGMYRADQVITVSHFTKNICIDRYSVPQNKITVVHNGVETVDNERNILPLKKPHDDKLVLFLGRITMQKGPEYFVAAAKKVLGIMDNVKFIMAGSGDMFIRTIELAAELGIGHKVLFSGFLQGQDVERIFRMADLYVMPSVSEPFGISPLEAMVHNVPVIISKQSGVAEILQHALIVDFWDINEMANKIIAVLRHSPLHETLKINGASEARCLQWHEAAQKCRNVYELVTRRVA